MQTIRGAAARLILPMTLLMASVGSARAQTSSEALVVKPTVVNPLLTNGGCLACHAVDKKVVGPAFREVAEKYKDDPTAADRLAEKILKGGVGVWGPVPMPPASGISSAEAKILATWVLAGAPAN